MRLHAPTRLALVIGAIVAADALSSGNTVCNKQAIRDSAQTVGSVVEKYFSGPTDRIKYGAVYISGIDTIPRPQSTGFLSNLSPHLDQDTTGKPDGSYIDSDPNRPAEIYFPNLTPYLVAGSSVKSFSYSINQTLTPLWQSLGVGTAPDNYSMVPATLSGYCALTWRNASLAPGFCKNTAKYYNSVFELENVISELMAPLVNTWLTVSSGCLAFYSQLRFGMLTYAPSLAVDDIYLASSAALGPNFVFNWPLNLTSPTNNPTRSLVWSNPYIDDVTKNFIISSFYPIDISGEFFGFQGVDIVLNDPSGIASVPGTDARPTANGFVFLMTMTGDGISVPAAVSRVLFPGIDTGDATQARNLYKTPVGNFTALKNLVSAMTPGSTAYTTVIINGNANMTTQTWSLGVYRMNTPPWVTISFSPMHELLELGGMNLPEPIVYTDVDWSTQESVSVTVANTGSYPLQHTLVIGNSVSWISPSTKEGTFVSQPNSVVTYNVSVDASNLPLGLQQAPVVILTADTVTGECFSSRDQLTLQADVQKIVNRVITVPWSSTGGIGAAIIISVMLTIIFLLMIWLFLNSNEKVVKAASFQLCEVILLGCAIGIASLYAWIGEPTHNTCRIRVWMGGIGFCMTFSALCIKNIRILVIFKSQNPKLSRYYSNEKLLMYTGACIGVESIYLLIWSLVDYIGPVYDLTSSALAIDEAAIMCQFGRISALTYIFVALKLVLVIVGIVLAVKTSSIDSEYNESQHIGLSMYNLVAIVILALVLSTSLSNTPTEQLGLAIGVMACIFLVTPLIFLFPKVSIVHFGDTASGNDRSILKTSNQVNSKTKNAAAAGGAKGVTSSNMFSETSSPGVTEGPCLICKDQKHGFNGCPYAAHIPDMVRHVSSKATTVGGRFSNANTNSNVNSNANSAEW